MAASNAKRGISPRYQQGDPLYIPQSKWLSQDEHLAKIAENPFFDFCGFLLEDVSGKRLVCSRFATKICRYEAGAAIYEYRCQECPSQAKFTLAKPDLLGSPDLKKDTLMKQSGDSLLNQKPVKEEEDRKRIESMAPPLLTIRSSTEPIPAICCSQCQKYNIAYSSLMRSPRRFSV